ncbi:MAG: methyltransferase family protein [Gemmatimonadales bacterium]
MPRRAIFRPVPFHRPATPAHPFRHVLKTLPVLAVFWLLTLGLIPALIVRAQRATELAALFLFPQQTVVGIVALAAGTPLVLWAGLQLVGAGGGTPLAYDPPRRLVISGPYAWLRNPMVVGFIVQGAGVGFLSGSILVALFFVVIALWWNALVRPLDEDKLQKTFGREYELYRRSVPCWVPLRRRWSPPPLTGPISLDELPEQRHSRRRR